MTDARRPNSPARSAPVRRSTSQERAARAAAEAVGRQAQLKREAAERRRARAAAESVPPGIA